MKTRTNRSCVLHLLSSEGLFGAEMVSLVLAGELKQSGLRPVIGVIENAYNPHTELIIEARERGIRSVSFPCRWQFDWSTVRLIRKFLKSEQVDLTHCHGYKSNLFGILAAPGHLPKVTTNHNWLTNDWRLKFYCFFDSLWIRRFDRIVAVSEEIRSDMVKRGVAPSKIAVIDNGVEIDRFSKRTESDHLRYGLGIDRNDIVIGTVGNLNWEKGHRYLIDAAKMILNECDRARFVIIGDGHLRAELRQKTIKAGLEKRFIFTGMRQDIPELLSIMDIFVLSSIKEGLPMVLLEAMAAGRAIVSTNVGAIPRVLENRMEGILVEPMDSEALGSSVIELMKTDGLIRVMGERARKRVVEQYSSKAMADRYIQIYKALLDRTAFNEKGCQ